ncbi:hypothetical protein J1N35_006440 [Gossypium stocksii]|uniref:Uncharacterized protein n=1 Tax=Gossypium stocksii TaxID=47602 RepID=A0A9D3WH77_9ROSI|nr:hypothetical protein J1N35_006440 [Gossypium stocksii]
MLKSLSLNWAFNSMAWNGLVYTAFILNFVLICQHLLLQPLVSALVLRGISSLSGEVFEVSSIEQLIGPSNSGGIVLCSVLASGFVSRLQGEPKGFMEFGKRLVIKEMFSILASFVGLKSMPLYGISG